MAPAPERGRKPRRARPGGSSQGPADTFQDLDAYYDKSWVGGAGRSAVLVIHAGSAWPAQRTDAGLAITWVKDNARRFGVDPKRIALHGFSSGGHIAVATSGSLRNVRAAVSVSGVLQPHGVMDVAVNGGTGSDRRTTSVVIRSQWTALAVQCPYLPAWGECSARWNSFKPETHFSAAAPPFYAMMGSVDTVVPSSTPAAVDYWATRKDQEHLAVMVPGAGHDERMLTGNPTRWAAM
ncbi:hypothetical protein GCM10023258_05420 [Terrabacter aeriphilus]|uniref:BD-FAE-like domain-containing protein n=2 Tax=Terrabacter aeriphilus TaxID=515662 RepID=A0ABP9J3N7_9MICO